MFGNTIISKLKEEISKNPYVIGLVLVGSYAREKTYIANEYSDMEVYVIVEDREVPRVEKDLVEITKKLGKVIFQYKNRWAGFSVVFDNFFRLELPIVKKSDIKTVFSRPVTQPVKVILDKTDGELQKTLDKRPKSVNLGTLFQEVFLDFWYMAIVAVQYFAKGEIWNARHAQEVVLVPLLIKLFELHDDKNYILLESNKRLEEFLEKERLALLRRVSSIYDLEEIRKSLIMTIEEFSGITIEVSKKYGFDYQRDVEKRIMPKLLRFLKDSG